MESNPVQKLGLDSGGSSIWKDVIKLKLGRVQILEEPGSNRNHHINFKKSEPDCRFSQKWRTDNTGFDLCCHFIFNLKNNGSPLFLCSYIELAIYLLFWKKNYKIWETIGKLFATFWPTFSFQIPQVHQLLSIPILISIKCCWWAVIFLQ
jgi:hypothetical protein